MFAKKFSNILCFPKYLLPWKSLVRFFDSIYITVAVIIFLNYDTKELNVLVANTEALKGDICVEENELAKEKRFVYTSHNTLSKSKH
jgi:hypothetical protein